MGNEATQTLHLHARPLKNQRTLDRKRSNLGTGQRNYITYHVILLILCIIVKVRNNRERGHSHLWQSQIEIDYYSVAYLSGSLSWMCYSAELPKRAVLIHGM